MIAPLGRALVLAALGVAAVGGVVGLGAGLRRSAAGRAWTFRLAYLFAALMLAANLLMEYALVAGDFSVSYAAHVGSRAVPVWVRVVSLWSSLEGSILFWGLMLGTFTAMVAWTGRKKAGPGIPLTLGVMLTVGVFFSFLIAGPANPFLTVDPAPLDGPGPNPLLQNHVLMVVHPPFLYLGYVGMTAPFAFAVAALLMGRLGPELLRPLRNWLLAAFGFLTVGIVLGGWWAYEVLGWGGYWAWDPVENASLLPWLTATAALHSLIVVERRGILKGWSMALILGSFLLTILGTFMTRSGIFNSVHSFSQSDIGPTILVFLGLTLVATILLLSSRVGALEAEGSLESGASREGSFLVNNLLLVTLTLTVLIGTVFPLVVEAVQGARMSVGEPYFNRMAVPLAVALLFLLGVGPALPWGRVTGREAVARLLPGIVGGLLVTGVGMLGGARSGWLLATLFMGGYALQVTLAQLGAPALARIRGRGEPIGSALASQLTQGRRRTAAYVVHAGVVVVLIAVGASSSLREHTEVSLNRDETAQLGPYRITFLGTRTEMEPHRQTVVARFAVNKDGAPYAELDPGMNYYFTMREPVGTPAVHTSAREDLYLSVMSVDPEAQRVGVRIFRNPLVAWIWIGAGIMAFGAVMALVPARRRAVATAGAPRPAAIPAGLQPGSGVAP